MNASLDLVLQHPGIGRGDRLAQTGDATTLPTGFAELDEQLPGGGWARGALTEILVEREGIGELRLLLPALAKLSAQSEWQAWVAPPHVPYAPALSVAGVNLKQLLVAQPRTAADAWWTVEQTLRSGACSAVLAWLSKPDERRMRRSSGLLSHANTALHAPERNVCSTVHQASAAVRGCATSSCFRLTPTTLKAGA